MFTSSLLATIVAFSQVVLASPITTDSHVQKRQDQQGVWQAYCLSDTPNLDQAGTDQSSDWLRGLFGSGLALQSDSTTHTLRGNIFNNAVVYGCVDAFAWTETFSAEDVDNALKAMDAACPRYASSWAILAVPDPAFNGQLFNSAKVIGKDVGSPLDSLESICNKNFGLK